MPGKYHHERSQQLAHDHVVFHMENGAIVTFNDPRRFGSMKLVARAELDQEPLLRALGPEPLGNAFDAAMLAHACKGKKTSLKAALSDQRIVAGLGNIYVCEALHRAPFAQAIWRRSRCDPEHQRARGRPSMPSRPCSQGCDRGGGSRCAITGEPTASSMFQHNFRVYDRDGNRVRRRAAKAPLSASCRLDDRRSIVRFVKISAADLTFLPVLRRNHRTSTKPH